MIPLADNRSQGQKALNSKQILFLGLPNFIKNNCLLKIRLGLAENHLVLRDTPELAIPMQSIEEAINNLMPEQEKDILLLELSRLRKRGVIDFSTYERAKEMWGI